MSALALSLKLSAIKTLSAAQRAINILKSAGPGAWYDPSDLATMFQDSAGTTPVTAVEQPVGRILDKSGGGNHLIQPTATSRPTLSSRYNLLTKTEAFDDAYWTGIVGGGGSVPVRVANDAVAPDGTTTADKLTFGAATTADLSLLNGVVSSLVTGGSYVVKAFVKAATPGDVGKSIVYRSVGGSSYSALTLTTDYQQISLTSVAAGPSTDGLSIGLRPAEGGSTGTVSVHIWGASLTTAADASLPYQRVNTATDYDYDFSKFPAYLKFDGVDDSLYTSAIDFTSTDKMTVFAGVHKASDAANAMFTEFSPNADSLPGAFLVIAAASASLPWLPQNGRTGARTYGQFPTGASPRTSVTTYVLDNAAVDEVVMRENGVGKTGVMTVDGGAVGNFSNYPLYVGRRNNASLPFNGRLYQLALKGKSMTAAEITTVESFVNSKTKAY